MPPAPTDNLEAENARLRAALETLQHKYELLQREHEELRTSSSARIRSLIDESEALADANRILLENAAAFARIAPTLTSDAPSAQIPDALLLAGHGITTTARAVLEDVHIAGNLLSVASPASKYPRLVVTGGVDKHVMVHDWTSQRRLCAFQASAPVLDIACNPVHASGEYVVASFMDARHALLRVVELDGAWRVDEIASFQDHTRHGAMRVAWSSCGQLFATGSSDKSVNIYKCEHLSDGDLPTCHKIKSFYFNGTVEALTFVPPTKADDSAAQTELLVIAVRDDCYVHYVDCQSFEKERINMNQDNIEHVSYTIMDLRVSPSGKYLLAATDKDRHLIFGVKSNIMFRNLYGHKAGPYSQPRAVWHPSEKYVVSNTEDSGVLFVWCVASERVVEHIEAHDKLIRALAWTKEDDATAQPVLLTVSYDKRLKAWSSVAAKKVVLP